MSATVQFTRSHLSKWHRAYGRISIYVAIAVIPLLIDKLSQVTEFSVITPVEWVLIILNALLQGLNVIRSFMDKTMTQISENRTP